MSVAKVEMAYKKLSGDEDDDATLDHAWLGIESRDLVLDLLERKRLFRAVLEAAKMADRRGIKLTYSELLNNGGGTENGGGLESQHRLLALFTRKD